MVVKKMKPQLCFFLKKPSLDVLILIEAAGVRLVETSIKHV